MKVFMTGATGVLGRRVLPALIAKGHTVVALSRSQGNTDWITRHGAEPRTSDLFDREQMASVSEDCDGILNLATAIPTKSRTTTADWSVNDRIRREGTRVLIDAALRNKCILYVQQSITLLYGDRAGDWVDETTPIAVDQPQVLQSASEMEQMVREAVAGRGLPGVVLRFGSFYSHDSKQTVSMLKAVRRGFFPLLGDGSAYWNMIAVDDAAAAVIATVKEPPRGIGGTFNICDDKPVMIRELTEYLAEELHSRKPRRIPIFLANMLLGSHLVRILTASVRCKNDRAKQSLGWMPRHRDYRAGFKAEIELWRQPG